MRIILLLVMFFGLHASSAQSDTEEKLIGKWVLIGETDSFAGDTEKLSIDGMEPDTEIFPEVILTFRSDNSLLVNQMGDESNSNFKIKDSILIMGNRKYILIKVDDEKLVFKDLDDLFDNCYEYKKLK